MEPSILEEAMEKEVRLKKNEIDAKEMNEESNSKPNGTESTGDHIVLMSPVMDADRSLIPATRTSNGDKSIEIDPNYCSLQKAENKERAKIDSNIFFITKKPVKKKNGLN